MNKKNKGFILNILALSTLSVMLYLVHFIFFKELAATIATIITSLAFAPIQIIFDSLVIDKIMEIRENAKKAKKINMVIGSFYNVIGNDILAMLVKSDPDNPSIKLIAKVSKKCCEDDFFKLKNDLMEYDFKIDINQLNLDELKEILEMNNSFLIDLMISSVIDEDEEFSRMVMAIVHLRDEFATRSNNSALKEYEKLHIKSDVEKAYRLLSYQWVDYMKYLKEFYMQLFVKALIQSPFDDRSNWEKDSEFLD